METEDTSPAAALKELQEEIVKQFGLSALAGLDAKADQIIKPHSKDDAGKVFLAYLALKAGVVVAED